MNKVILSGRLTRDVETKTGKSTTFARTGIAVNRPTKAKEFDFFNLVAFGTTADFMAKYCQKGTKLLIEGHLNFSQYEDKQGQKKSSVSVIVDSVEFTESKSANQNNRIDDGFGGEPVEDGDYPF